MNFQENAEKIKKTYEEIRENDKQRQIQPAEEWIYDNYYVIDENIRMCQHSFINLPKIISKKKINNIYNHMSNIVKQNNGMIDDKKIINYITNLNKTKPLSTKEIGTIEEVMRFALISQLALVCEYLDYVRTETEKAENLYSRYLSYIGTDDERSSRVWINAVGDISPVFAQTVLKLSAASSGDTTKMRTILTRKIAGRNTTIDEIIAIEHKNAISNGVLAGNLINSMRALGNLNWQYITSMISTVKRILDQDPAGIFANMTEESRDEYVRIVNKIARKTGKTAETVAMEAIEMAQDDNKVKHVGFYIYKMNKEKRQGKAFVIYLIFTTIVLCFCPGILLLSRLVRSWQHAANTQDIVLTVFITVASLFIIIFTGIIAFNISLRFAQKRHIIKSRPTVLPAINFNGRLPEYIRVMVVIPCLISSDQRVRDLIGQIERIYFTNNDENICYMLLCDLPEASSRDTESDNALISACQEGINSLNRKYCEGTRQRFFCKIRGRTFYEKDNKWMGYERKRGALIELNNDIIQGKYSKISYVLTVDADTIIPSQTVCRMVQIMEHPMNKPVVEYKNNIPIVTKGYGILQPAVIPLVKKKDSLFTKIYVNRTGFDIYGIKYSDFYFDIFKEGIYTGKGMYDPILFNHVVGNIFPDNSILSHDLLEGSFMRTAFASDIRLYDGYPKNYMSYTSRQCRWIRGDWQLLAYIRKGFTTINKRYVLNPINRVSKFKMISNLMGSLLHPAIMLSFILGILFLQDYLYLWFAILIIGLAVGTGVREFIFEFLVLPHKAVVNLDSIIRALWRTNVTGRNMLDWVTSADSDRKSGESIFTYYSEMIPNLIAAVIGFSVWKGILSVIWLCAPFIAYLLSKPAVYRKKNVINTKQEEDLRETALKIWKYYETYANAENNFLPPDNIQVGDSIKVAHRTSPTNIGFCFLSVFLSLRLGFISQEKAIDIAENIMETIKKLPKVRGHLYNWIDTKKLNVLNPHFISTVDSGNFIACLIAADSMITSLVIDKPSLKRRACQLDKSIQTIVSEIDFSFLYDANKKALSTGFNVDENKISESFYDIICSEARLTMYLAVALQHVPVECYTRAVRRYSMYNQDILLSWSGTAFEYLLPELFLYTEYENMWEKLSQNIINVQYRYSKQFHIPWGISESGYYMKDVGFNFKYKAHGIPELAISRNVEDCKIISPYSSIMALRFAPKKVINNLQRMSADGANSEYGYFEAIDYSKDSNNIVSSYMAHHLGMEIAALCDFLCDGYLRKTFMNHPLVASAEYLLAERENNKGFVTHGFSQKNNNVKNNKIISRDDVSDVPEICREKVGVYSNGEFCAAFMEDEIIKTTLHGITVTDRIQFFASSNRPKVKNTYVYPEKAEVSAQTLRGELRYDMCVPAEDNCIVYRIKAEPNSVISLYTELKMVSDMDYEAHPAFSSIFVITDMVYVANNPVIVARRISGRENQRALYVCAGFTSGIHPEYDTDALYVRGRNNEGIPEIIANDRPLAGNLGAVLYPCLSFDVKSPEDGELGFYIGCAYSLEEAVHIAEKYTDFSNVNRAFELSRTRCMIEKEHLNIAIGDISFFFVSMATLIKSKRSQISKRKLWPFGISGDNPIICVSISYLERVEEIKRIMRFWSFCGFRGFVVDLVLVCCDQAGYLAPVRDMAELLVARTMSLGNSTQGQIFVIASENGNCPTELKENADLFYCY